MAFKLLTIISTLLCLLGLGLANCPNGDHDWDGELRLECPNGQALYFVQSHHDNHREDRCWDWSCRSVAASFYTSYWTGYQNGHDLPLLFQCAANYVLCGVHSVHNDHTEDRVWEFKCCRTFGYCTKSCSLSGNLNSLDGPMNYAAGSGEAFVGAYSFHNNHAEDRVWKISQCKYSAGGC